MPVHKRPGENSPCPDCGGSDWEQKHRHLPDIGWTRVCGECGSEMFVYDAGDMPGGPYQLQPVTKTMARYLLFSEATGEHPDEVLRQYRSRGLSEPEALDYYAVEKSGLSQSSWAEGLELISQQAVSENVRKAKNKLQ